MNETVDLTKILKDCPNGWELYSSVLGYVKFEKITGNKKYPINVICKNGYSENYTANGKLITYCGGECTLFPSREQRDWSKFNAPWYKKDKFDPKMLKAFDRVLCKNGLDMWCCDFFSSYVEAYMYPNVCISGSYIFCIPYNDETKHLVGTTEEAPEYYRYWEN